MHIQIDLPTIEKLGAERQEENDHFKLFLKNQPAALVDELVMGINKHVEAAIDCLACGKCCTKLMVNIDDAAVLRLAERLQLTEAQFRERFVETG